MFLPSTWSRVTPKYCSAAPLKMVKVQSGLAA
jgi:hypothetical protein